MLRSLTKIQTAHIQPQRTVRTSCPNKILPSDKGELIYLYLNIKSVSLIFSTKCDLVCRDVAEKEVLPKKSRTNKPKCTFHWAVWEPCFKLRNGHFSFWLRSISLSQFLRHNSQASVIWAKSVVTEDYVQMDTDEDRAGRGKSFFLSTNRRQWKLIKLYWITYTCV